jgi:hypothetical protein
LGCLAFAAAAVLDVMHPHQLLLQQQDPAAATAALAAAVTALLLLLTDCGTPLSGVAGSVLLSLLLCLRESLSQAWLYSGPNTRLPGAVCSTSNAPCAQLHDNNIQAEHVCEAQLQQVRSAAAFNSSMPLNIFRCPAVQQDQLAVTVANSY